MKIRFVQDIQEGATRLYAKGEIIECDARMGRVMIGTKHAVAADEGLKSTRDEKQVANGCVVMSTPQGRVTMPIGDFKLRVVNNMCDAGSTVLVMPRQGGMTFCTPGDGYFDIEVGWTPDGVPSVFDYAILPH